MENNNFIGSAWADDYGITATIKVDEFKKLIESGDYPINQYGEVRIRVGKLKQVNERSKATHFVRMYTVKSEF